MTAEHIEQKKQRLKQLAEEVKALTQELAEAGAIELSEDDLDNATGGAGICPEIYFMIPEPERSDEGCTGGGGPPGWNSTMG